MSRVTSYSYTPHRHLLHHPFFPLDSSSSSSSSSSLPPSLSPQPPPQLPKYPFSSSSSYPFFPSDPPPPPQPPSIASFPVNISSLVFHDSPSHNHHHFKLIILSISLSALLLSIFLLLALLLHRRTRQNAAVSHKPLTSDINSHHTPSSTITTSDGSRKTIPHHPPPPLLRRGRGIIGTSTEFLYLGTLMNSSGMNSPELRPLPPLPKFNHFTSGEQIGSKIEEEDDEEFFSPRRESGSSGVLRFVEDQKTASFPYSNSTSPDHNPAFVLRSPSLSSSPEIELGRPRIMPTRVSYVQKTQPPQKVSNLHPPPYKNDGLEDWRRETLKLKLKPLHWDKPRGSSEKAMAWDEIKSSSFVLNEEMIESLCTVKATRSLSNEKGFRNVLPYANQDNFALDSWKSQNISILLRALNVTADEVCEALLEGNTDALGSELLESLLKMAPSKEEEQSLKQLEDEASFKLAPAEKFLKMLLKIPFAFERMDAMLYMTSFDSEVEFLMQSFQTLEAACDELKRSKKFRKLLEAVLKVGNQMNVGTNRGEASPFKLNTLLKLVDVKGADGKTTLLHFVVQEIIGDEDPTSNQGSPFGSQDEVESRKRRLQVVTSLIGELSNVKKAAEIDFGILSSEVKKLASQIPKVSHVLKLSEKNPADENTHKFTKSVTIFLNKAEAEIARIQIQQNAAFTLMKEVTEYFHGDSSKEEAHPFRIFLVVRDFLSILDRVCKEVGMRNMRTILGSGSVHSSYHPNHNQSHVFPQFIRRQQTFTSGDQRSSSLNYGLAHSWSV